MIRYSSKVHGTYEATSANATAAIAMYVLGSGKGPGGILPTLVKLLDEKSPDIDWSDLTLADVLIVLASFWIE